MSNYHVPADMSAFRRMYSNLVRKKTNSRLELSQDKKDHWIILRRKGLTYIHVVHKINHSYVDLALFDYNYGYVGDSVPAGSIDVSVEKTRMFRWNVDPVAWDKHPAEQDGVEQVIARALWCFDWVRDNKKGS